MTRTQLLNHIVSIVLEDEQIKKHIEESNGDEQALKDLLDAWEHAARFMRRESGIN